MDTCGQRSADITQPDLLTVIQHLYSHGLASSDRVQVSANDNNLGLHQDQAACRPAAPP